jgi:hypothetical protein
VAVFEGEFGDAGLVEVAEVFGDHAIVLFLGRACAAGRGRDSARSRCLWLRAGGEKSVVK